LPFAGALGKTSRGNKHAWTRLHTTRVAWPTRVTAGGQRPLVPLLSVSCVLCVQVEYGLARVRAALAALYRLAQGGTAVGTGLNTKVGFDKAVAAQVCQAALVVLVPEIVPNINLYVHLRFHVDCARASLYSTGG
jgi:hypothetical protein